jgi:hypothetical protein
MAVAHNLTIARSGIQLYLRNELPGMGLTSIPREMSHLRVFAVYRPAHIVQDAAPLFKNALITKSHDKWITSPNDAHVIGRTGDDVSIQVVDGEAILHSTAYFNDQEAEVKDTPVSPGYKAKYRWEPGITKDGIEYQIIASKIFEVNHVAFVPRARGGELIRVLDGGEHVNPRKILSGLLHFAKKAIGVKDTDLGAFRSTMEDIVTNRLRWSDEEMAEHANTLMAFASDLPDSEQKEKLVRFIADVPLLKNEEDAVVNQAAIVLCDLYDQLSTDAVDDVSSAGYKEAPMETEVEQVPAAVPAVPVAAPPPEKKDPVGAMETLQKVYLVLKELFGEASVPAASAEPEVAAEAAAEGESVEEETAEKKPTSEAPPAESAKAEEKEEKKPEGVRDGMPIYTQTLQTVQTGDSLEELHGRLKNRRT